MNTGFLEYLTCWGPYIVGILAMIYAVILKLGRTGVCEEQNDSGGSALPLMLAGGSLIVAFILIGTLAVPQELSWRYAVVFLIGGVSALVTFAFSHCRRESITARSSDVFFAIGIGVLEMAILRNYFREAPMIYLFVGALGIWFAAALLAYGGSNRAGLGVRTLALAAAVIAAAVSLGIYHYPESPNGSLFAVNACALVLLLSISASFLTLVGGKLRAVAGLSAAVVLLGLTWWLGVLLARAVIDESVGGLCALIGAVAVLLLAWISTSATDRGDTRSSLISPVELGILSILIAVAVLAMGMRWLAGYGISLVAVGGLSALPLVYVILDRSAPAPRHGIAANSSLAVAALAAVAYVRVFLEATSGHGVSVDLFETYTVPGLVIGGSLALMLGLLATTRRAALSVYFRGMSSIVLGCAIALAVAYFWRLEAVNGLMIGIAAGVFYTIVTASLSEDSNDAVSLVLGVSLFTVTLIPAFLDATLNLTRDQKIGVLMWVMCSVAFLFVAMGSARAILGARREAAERSSQE